jgi:hypothetical protein
MWYGSSRNRLLLPLLLVLLLLLLRLGLLEMLLLRWGLLWLVHRLLVLLLLLLRLLLLGLLLLLLLLLLGLVLLRQVGFPTGFGEYPLVVFPTGFRAPITVGETVPALWCMTTRRGGIITHDAVMPKQWESLDKGWIIK